ncbi:MAG TPA: spore cortex-lytic enzyme [Firmicutes bacterium]|nr:spore cortex-lytic enzyme [Bacillota bacterium]
MEQSAQRRMVHVVRILILVALNLCIIGLALWAPGESVEALSQRGSRGEEVRQIQTALQNRGYDPGSVDGIYGERTEAAVRQFQADQGLAVDGIAGPDTLAALGVSGSSNGATSVSNSDYYLLARIISAEARGEPYTGQVAVGAVVLNRVKHPSFPDTIAGVIYQPGAFSAINDGQFDQPIAESAYRAAQDALNGWDPSGGAVFYFNPDKTSDAFMHSRPVIKRIGDHLFCS